MGATSVICTGVSLLWLPSPFIHFDLLSMKRLLPLVVAALSFGCLVQSLRAQENRILEILREKIRYTPEQIELLEARGGQDEREAHSVLGQSAAGGEVVVSGDAAVESEVHAAINPLDTQNVIVSPIRQGTNLDCPIYYTTDFGSTWSRGQFQATPRVPGTTVLGGGDPVLAYDLNGRAFITWLSFEFGVGVINARMYWAYSDDRGATWTRPDGDVVVEHTATLQGTGTIIDKQWMATDASQSQWRGSLYAAFLETTGDESHIGLRYLRAGDILWSKTTITISDVDLFTVQFCDLVVDESGVIHVSYWGSPDGSNYALYHAASSDGGATFGASTMISWAHMMNFTAGEDGSTIAGVDARRIYPCPHIAVDNSGGAASGNLYAVWTAQGTTTKLANGLDIYFSRSSDGGNTWSSATIVNSDPPDRGTHQFYPSISVSPAGVIAVTWYDRRSDPSNRRTEYYLSYSFDAGATFTPGFAVSTQPTDFATVGSRNSSFGIGEYTQVLTTSSYALPVWTDGRSNDGNLNIYAAVVPISLDGAGADAVIGVSSNFDLVSVLPDGPDRFDVVWQMNRPGSASVEVLDMLGNVVVQVPAREVEEGSHSTSIALEGVARGAYFVRLVTSFGTSAVRINRL